MLNRRALSDVVETPGKRREETRAVEMVQIGQALKLEAIVRGLAPTSLATVGPLKPRPWEPRCIFPDFPSEVVCGDVWSENRLILATDNGTFLIEGERLRRQRLSSTAEYYVLLISMCLSMLQMDTRTDCCLTKRCR